MSRRFPIIVQAPASAGVALRVRAGDDTTEGRVFASATSTTLLDQPRAIAAGASLTVYVDGPSVYYVSATVNGSEMAGGYGARRRVECEGGLTRVTVGAPPVTSGSTATNVIAAVPPANPIATVTTVEVVDTPDAGTFSLILTTADLDDPAIEYALETGAIDFDATEAEMATACEAALVAGGFAGADVSGASDDLTFTFPYNVVVTLGDNDLTISDEAGGDVDITPVTVGTNGDRGYIAGTEWVDSATGISYTNIGGVGLIAAGTGTDPNWVQTSAAIVSIPALDTTTDEASVVAQFNILRTALIANGLATDGD
jgi:hypothetical protein